MKENLTLVYISLIVLFVPANLFPILYSRFPWKDSLVGISLILSSVGMMLLVDVSVLVRVIGYEPPIPVRATVYFLIGAASWIQLFIVIRAMRRNATADQHGKDKEYNEPSEA